jgi:hypothetical protein
MIVIDWLSNKDIIINAKALKVLYLLSIQLMQSQKISKKNSLIQKISKKILNSENFFV